MTNKEVRDAVSNFSSWGGNAFTLAMLVVQQEREDAAVIAESLGHQDVADAIRQAQ